MLLRCCLIHISIIILRHLCFLYLCPCLSLGLFMSCLCDTFFIFIFIFIMINRMNADTLVLLLIFQNMPYYFWMITRMKNGNNFQIATVQPQGVTQHLLEFLPISAWRCLKVLLRQKKRVVVARFRVQYDSVFKASHILPTYFTSFQASETTKCEKQGKC